MVAADYTRIACILLVTVIIARPQTCANAVDSIDPDYGGSIRQLVKPDGHEHNLTMIATHGMPIKAICSAFGPTFSRKTGMWSYTTETVAS
jgi:hypothetical protein